MNTSLLTDSRVLYRNLTALLHVTSNDDTRPHLWGAALADGTWFTTDGLRVLRVQQDTHGSGVLARDAMVRVRAALKPFASARKACPVRVDFQACTLSLVSVVDTLLLRWEDPNPQHAADLAKLPKNTGRVIPARDGQAVAMVAVNPALLADVGAVFKQVLADPRDGIHITLHNVGGSQMFVCRPLQANDRHRVTLALMGMRIQ